MRRRMSHVKEWTLSILLVLAVVLAIRFFMFEITTVDGDSMHPTLHTNERIAVEKISRYFGMPKRGDILIVKYPDRRGSYVKRAIGLPGETIEIIDSMVYIDGRPISEPYIHSVPYRDMDAFLVPSGHIFVMGDNRAHSLDSRTKSVGAIPKKAIMGHGFFVVWPFENLHRINVS